MQLYLEKHKAKLLLFWKLDTTRFTRLIKYLIRSLNAMRIEQIKVLAK